MRRKKKNKPESLSVRIKDVRNHSFVEPISIPKYESDGAVGFDFVCHGNTHINDVHGTVIEAGRMKLIPTGVIVEVPKGYMLMVVPRSSTARKYNLMMPNSVGIIDNDYCGEDDEILIPVYNFGEHDVFVKTGDKIAQGVIVKIATADFVEVDSMAEESRGGFGSTDKKNGIGILRKKPDRDEIFSDFIFRKINLDTYMIICYHIGVSKWFACVNK